MHLSTSQAAPGATIEDRIENLLERMTLEEKIRLCHAGSKQQVPRRQYCSHNALWSDAKEDWVIEPGEFLIEVGVSSRRIILQRTINLDERSALRVAYFNSAL